MIFIPIGIFYADCEVDNRSYCGIYTGRIQIKILTALPFYFFFNFCFLDHVC